MHHKNDSKKHVYALYRLFTVEPRDLISSSLVSHHATRGLVTYLRTL